MKFLNISLGVGIAFSICIIYCVYYIGQAMNKSIFLSGSYKVIEEFVEFAEDHDMRLPDSIDEFKEWTHNEYQYEYFNMLLFKENTYLGKTTNRIEYVEGVIFQLNPLARRVNHAVNVRNFLIIKERGSNE